MPASFLLPAVHHHHNIINPLCDASFRDAGVTCLKTPECSSPEAGCNLHGWTQLTVPTYVTGVLDLAGTSLVTGHLKLYHVACHNEEENWLMLSTCGAEMNDHSCAGTYSLNRWTERQHRETIREDRRIAEWIFVQASKFLLLPLSGPLQPRGGGSRIRLSRQGQAYSTFSSKFSPATSSGMSSSSLSSSFLSSPPSAFCIDW